MTKQQPRFCSWFNNPDRSDVLLHIHVGHDNSDHTIPAAAGPDVPGQLVGGVQAVGAKRQGTCLANATSKQHRTDEQLPADALTAVSGQHTPASAVAATATDNDVTPAPALETEAAPASAPEAAPTASAPAIAVAQATACAPASPTPAPAHAPDQVVSALAAATATVKAIATAAATAATTATATASAAETATTATEVAVYARTYHAHAVILSVQSEYFDARLSLKWQQQQQQQAAAGVHVPQPTLLVEHVEEAELPAFDLLLHLMYSHEPPVSTPTDLLLQCLVLADRFQAGPSIDTLLRRLEAASQEQSVTPDLLASIAALPECVKQQPRFQGVMKACQKTLLQVYGNAPAVASSEALRDQFCDLPFAAVLAWAESDELEVHSENCVVFLLSAWVDAQLQPNTEQLQQLAHQVRVLHLGAGYQFQVLPSLKWFRTCSNMQHLNTLLMFKTSTRARGGVHVFPPPEHAERLDLVVAGAWLAPPRKHISMQGTLTWDIDAKDLAKLYDDKKLEGTGTLYMNGFLLDLHLNDGAAPATPGTGVQLMLYVDVNSSAMYELGVSWPSVAYVMLGAVNLKVKGPTANDCEEAEIAAGPINPGTQWGHSFGKVSPGSLEEVVAHYLMQGKLRIQAEFTSID